MKSLFTEAFLHLIIFIACVAHIHAQKSVQIGIIIDNPVKDRSSILFEQNIQDEIDQLLGNRLEIVYHEIETGTEYQDIVNAIDRGFNNPEIDILIASGAISSSIMAARKSFPKPSIASIIMDVEIQNAAITEQFTSGVNNFTYIQSPFNSARDFRKLYAIKPFKKIGILAENYLQESLSFFGTIFERSVEDLQVEFEILAAQADPEITVELIPDDIEALYILPLFSYDTPDYLHRLLEGINQKKIATASLLGEDYIDAGVLMAYESNDNINRLPRRIALNVMKIVEGANASDLPVLMPTYQENLLINFSTAHETGIFPQWDIMTSSIVVNFEEVHTDRVLSLKGVIAEALHSNLSLQISKYDVDISEKDIEFAKGQLLPQMDVSTSIAQLDENSSRTSFGSRGRLNWMANGKVSQILFSEPARANVAINKFLKQGKEYALEAAQFDLSLEVVNAYLGVLQAKSFLTIQGGTVRVTKENYDISRAKKSVGYSGASDLNRWESELALKNIDFNDAIAQLQQAKFNLNRILNHPIDEPFDVEELGRSDPSLLATDIRLQGIVNNHGEMHDMADFLVQEALQRLPVLKELNTNISLQKRLLKSSERANYLPSASLTAQLDHVLQKWSFPEGVSPTEKKAQWSIGLGVQYPIFQGKTRKIAVEQDRLALDQLKYRYSDVEQFMELNVRVLMETAIASYTRVDLSREAASAAQRNFEILQDSYNQGVINITSLIDAQNSSVLTDLKAVNAEYTFIADFIALERAMGFYFFLATDEERDDFIRRLGDYMTLKKK